MGWVVVTRNDHWLHQFHSPAMELVTQIGPHKIFKTKIEPSLVIRGGGEVEVATNRISVRGSDPDADLELRFHWMGTLRCRPDCQIERIAVDGVDPVGFMRIPAPHPADLEIYNSYDFSRRP